MPWCRFEGEYQTGQPSFRFSASAPGYWKLRVNRPPPNLHTGSHEGNPTWFKLQSYISTVPCIAVEAGSEQPLPEVTLLISGIGKIITDKEGRFDFPILLERLQSRRHMSLSIPDLGLAHDSWWEKESFEMPEWEVPFSKVIRDGVKIEVRDVLGQPVSGADIMFTVYDKNGASRQTTGQTDRNGIYIKDILLTEPIDCIIWASHPEYIRDTTGRFQLGPAIAGGIAGEREVFEFELTTGFLLQNLRVVDGKGDPIQDIRVEAKLFFSDGGTWSYFGISEKQGYCSIRFPPFLEGTLGVFRRPDTTIRITYEQLLKQGELCLVCKEEFDSAHAVEGRLQDREGNGLQNVSVRYSEMEEDPHWRNLYTDDDGRFRFLAKQDRLYQVWIKPHRDGDFWYTVENEEGLTAGSHIDLTMDDWHAVNVRLWKILDNLGNYPRDYQAFLEDETGKQIGVQETILEPERVLFLNPPPGRFRAVITTREGKIYTTALFEVEEGKSHRFSNLTEK